LAEREIELKQAEAQYRALVEQITAVIYTANVEKDHSQVVLSYISPQITRLTEYTVAECLAETDLLAWACAEDRPRIQAEMTRLFAAQQSSWALEYRILAKNKQFVWVRNEANLLCNAMGQPNLIQGTLTDITERKQAQKVIEIQAAALRDLSTPIMQISDNAILLPMIGAIDSHRAKQMMELALSEIEKRHAKVILIDITGVSVVDSQVANAIIQTTQAIKLLGACAVLTGIRSEVAQSIVALGIDLSSIVVHSTLQNGIAYALKQQKK
jgi:rsbT co-antagonist protein RsbR